MMKKHLAVAIATFTVATAQAALEGRDINGNSVAGNDASSVFLYDTTLNITWLRDANAVNSAADGRGARNWAEANDWASTLTVGSFGRWRLPSINGAICGGYNCSSGEMGHLFYTELGNAPGTGGFTNTGAFQGFGETDFRYWYKEDAGSAAPGYAWIFDMTDGNQRQVERTYGLLALAVRDGDVLVTSAVPNPASAWLALSGIGLLGAVARRRKAA